MSSDLAQARAADSYLKRGGLADRLLLIALVGVGFFLSWFTLTFGAASSFVPGNFNGLHAGWAAAVARPSSAAIKDAVARARTPNAFAIADLSAKRVLDAQPLDTMALEAMMTSAAKQNNFLYADALARLIVRRDARSTPAQFWLFGRGAVGADYAESLSHADSLLRASPELSLRIFAWLSAMASDPRAVKPLVALLANRPPWRGWFLEFLSSEAKVGLPTADAVFQALQDTDRPPTMTELQGYLSKLVNSQQYAKAYVLWLQALPRQALKTVTPLYDSKFEGLPGAGPFNWTLTRANGGYGEFAPSPSGAGQALHVGYGGDVNISLARQVILLSPGRYVLTGRYAPDGESASGQFRIAVTCMPLQNGAHVVDSHQMAEGDFAASFEIPDVGCEAQQVDILGDAAMDSGPVSAWYSKLHIEPAASVPER